MKSMILVFPHFCRLLCNCCLFICLFVCLGELRVVYSLDVFLFLYVCNLRIILTLLHLPIDTFINGHFKYQLACPTSIQAAGMHCILVALLLLLLWWWEGDADNHIMQYGFVILLQRSDAFYP